jgi:hypothetical protein
MSETELPEDAPEITPQVLHLRDLLKWVRQGRVRVPNFQRDFTWDRARMRDLFDSIRKQYPIGTLLFWESTKPRPMSDHLGPLRLPDYAGGRLLVLDGQQRLTTLAGVLLFDELDRSPEDDRDPGRWLVYYDADTNSFTYFDGPPPLSAVKVSELMGTKRLYDVAQRILGASNEKHDAKNRAIWVARIETVSAALAAYRVPLVIFATDSLRLAVESFTRLNRSGQSMGPDEMFSALTYAAEDDGRETFRLAKHVDAILSEIARTGFGPVDRVVVLRAVLLAAHLDPFRTEWDKLAEDTQKDVAQKLPLAIAEARKGLLGAVAFLRAEGIRNSRLLPYSMQLAGLAAFFGRREELPTEAQITLLRRWLWVSAFTEGFGGLNPSRMLLQLKDLRDVIPTQPTPTTVDGILLDAPAHPFPARHDIRSARVRALLCVMLQERVFMPDGTPLELEQMAAEVLKRGPDALARVCSTMKSGGQALLSSPANRVFDVVPNKGGRAKTWLLALDPTAQRDILDSHHVSALAWDALSKGDHRLFVEERIKSLVALERRFMAEKHVVPPTKDSPALSAIDVEDDVPLSDDAEMEPS